MNGMGHMLIQRGRAVAFVGASRWYLTPQIEALPRDDRDRRGITALCLALVHDPRFLHLSDDPTDD